MSATPVINNLMEGRSLITLITGLEHDTARREYWRFLNHDYRDLYRAHREEEKASQAQWESELHIANSDTRSWSRKLIDRISFT